MKKRKKQPCVRSPRRAGVATVELAVCLPLLVLIVFGSIQACDLIYLRHGVTTAAYEGSLEAARPDATRASVEARMEQVLELRGVKNGTVNIAAAAPIENLNVGDDIRLIVRAPIGPNLKISGFFGVSNQIRVTFDCTR